MTIPAPEETLARLSELDFMRLVMLALGRRSDMTVWRQNCGQIAIRDRAGKVVRYFDAGPPNGAGDISGFIRPEGWRLEIEVKAAGGKRSKAQEIFAQIVSSGGCVYVLTRFDPELDEKVNVGRAVRDVEHAIALRRAAS